MQVLYSLVKIKKTRIIGFWRNPKIQIQPKLRSWLYVVTASTDKPKALKWRLLTIFLIIKNTTKDIIEWWKNEQKNKL